MDLELDDVLSIFSDEVDAMHRSSEVVTKIIVLDNHEPDPAAFFESDIDRFQSSDNAEGLIGLNMGTHSRVSYTEKDLQLCCDAAAAAAAAEADQEDTSDEKQPSQQEFGIKFMVAMKNYRITSGDSGDWVNDVGCKSADFGTVDPSIFGGTVHSLSPSPLGAHIDEDYQAPLQPLEFQPLPMLPLSESLVLNGQHMLYTHTLGMKQDTSQAPPPESTKKRRRSRKLRELDLSCSIEPREYDVKFGRGGVNNIHPGNVYFRQKAREFRELYRHPSTTKNQKQQIATDLVSAIKNEGRRFVEKGKDGLWHEVIYGAHTKASQALRDTYRVKW